MRQSLLWDAQNPATASDIRAYLAQHPDAQLEQILRAEPRNAGRAGGGGPARPLTPEQRAAAAAVAARSAEDRAAYAQLNEKHLAQAEMQFKAILANHPDDANALAGMGYVRMQQANFAGALNFLVQAREDGSKDPGLPAAIATSQFWNTMAIGQVALDDDQLRVPNTRIAPRWRCGRPAPRRSRPWVAPCCASSSSRLRHLTSCGLSR